MPQFSETYFAELEQELADLSAEERASILRELHGHTEDALSDPQSDDHILRMGLPSQVRAIGRSLLQVHNAARREARKRKSMLIISTVMASIVIVLSFIFPWIDGNVIGFVLGGTAVVCATVSLIGMWLPKRKVGRWLVWSGSTGLTLVGMPTLVSFGSLYLICGPLLLWTGMRSQRA